MKMCVAVMQRARMLVELHGRMGDWVRRFPQSSIVNRGAGGGALLPVAVGVSFLQRCCSRRFQSAPPLVRPSFYLLAVILLI